MPLIPLSSSNIPGNTVLYLIDNENGALTPLGMPVKDLSYKVGVRNLSAVRDVFPTKGA